ncbi:MAG: hypothetical protein R3270_10910 [Gammaproteobacteria bacterium]|nr:hypothetical protein [Gammaproteobacteria bacterium]
MRIHILAISVLLVLQVAIAGCALVNADPPMMGTVENGVYTHPKGRFSCPVNASLPGLDGELRIVDARRIVKTEYIPLRQRAPGDPKNNRVVSDETVPANTVRFDYASGAVVEFTSGLRRHTEENVLQSGMSGGLSWRFDRREIAREPGRMMTGILLVPWHDENDSYMGTNIAERYRLGEGPDPTLWIHSNIVISQRVHTVTAKLPIGMFLAPGSDHRDLRANRDSLGSRLGLHDKLFTAAENWLATCQFAGEDQ